jgi:siderophore synthetase component
MNATIALMEPVGAHSNVDAHVIFLSNATKRCLQRTLQALFREGLLSREHLITEGGISWLPLWPQQAILRFEGLTIGGIGNCELHGSVSCYRTGERPQPIVSAAALVACVTGMPGDMFTAQDRQRLMQELDNCVDNETLCLTYRHDWGQALRAQITAGHHESFLAALRSGAFDNPVLLLEQWGTVGHPWHPTYKTRLGLTPQEVCALSPEFQANVTVQLAAIRADKVRLAMSEDGQCFAAWFAGLFPAQWEAWTDRLQQDGLNPCDWLPLPMHPWQADRLIPQEFAAEIRNGELKILAGLGFPASPTMSFRTVVPGRSTTLPHMKLPVSLRLTSVQRTVSPKSAVMGPRLTRLITHILAHEHGFDGTLDVVGEVAGLHYLDPDGNDDRARHLSALFRINPACKIDDELFPVPVGALFADTPLTGRPLVTELIDAGYGDHAGGALRFFEQYTATVLRAVLAPYLLYGIAFEAHQQNSFIMVDRRGHPVRLLVRDFGDLRIHRPTLRRTGLDLQAYRAGHTLFDNNDPVRDKLVHAVLLCHLSELAILLSRSYCHPESAFWNMFRHQLDFMFDRLRPRTESQRWHAERHHLLEAAWPAKAFVRMRLCDTSDDLHGSMPNPLRSGART